MRDDYDAGRGGWGGQASLEYDHENNLDSKRAKSVLTINSSQVLY